MQWQEYGGSGDLKIKVPKEWDCCFWRELVPLCVWGIFFPVVIAAAETLVLQAVVASPSLPLFSGQGTSHMLTSPVGVL